MQGRDLLPAEVRVWEQLFGEENPDALRWAFREHLRKERFFPKPADITWLLTVYAAEHAVKPEKCDQCGGSGWLVDEKTNRATRCDCIKAAKE